VKLSVRPEPDRDIDEAADYYVQQGGVGLATKFLEAVGDHVDGCADRLPRLLAGHPSAGGRAEDELCMAKLPRESLMRPISLDAAPHSSSTFPDLPNRSGFFSRATLR
jgi:hypothetical protein